MANNIQNTSINYNNQINNNAIPQYNNIQISLNNNSQINNYIQQIENLKFQLYEEKDKNEILINENNNLKMKIAQLNNEINKLKGLEKQIKILENNLAKKNIKKQNNLSQKAKKPYEITSIKPGEKILSVNFVSMGTQDIGHFSLECKNVDLFVSLEERLTWLNSAIKPVSQRRYISKVSVRGQIRISKSQMNKKVKMMKAEEKKIIISPKLVWNIRVRKIWIISFMT